MRAAIGLGGVVLVGFVTVHCSGLEERSDCLDYDTCQGIVGEGGAGEAGDGGKEGAVIPPTCDLTKGVKDSPDCVDDGVGIFAAPTGDDTGPGTKSKPVRSIAKALELASSSGRPRVYACEGTFDKQASITTSVSIYGGLSCAWQPKADARPKLAPPKGVALSITRVSGAVVIEDLEIVGSSDPSVPGDSAIAVFVSESKDVVFRRSTIVAGNGQPGGKGKTGSNYNDPTALKGKNSAAGAGGQDQTCACLDGKTSSKTGRGGTASGPSPTSGSATPVVGGLNAGANSSASCVVGTAGANGEPEAKGTGATSPGTLTVTGWAATTLGIAGGTGNPGQGGGGGGAIDDIISGGAGGGCGGCGGRGGDPGPAGGSSIALLSFESTIIVSGGGLSTGAGGKGGAGGDGQVGQAGGASGLGACVGGSGGIGAGGSGGGGGAGGHSVVVVYRGKPPSIDGATTTPGPKGPPGDGGAGGQGGGNPGNAGDPGAEGMSGASLMIQ